MLKRGSVIVPNLLKFQDYIVRLKSPKGILMMKNYVFGGTFSETSTFKVQIGTVHILDAFPCLFFYLKLSVLHQAFLSNEYRNSNRIF